VARAEREVAHLALDAAGIAAIAAGRQRVPEGSRREPRYEMFSSAEGGIAP
jgi:hypothetical protein